MAKKGVPTDLREGYQGKRPVPPPTGLKKPQVTPVFKTPSPSPSPKPKS